MHLLTNEECHSIPKNLNSNVCKFHALRLKMPRECVGKLSSKKIASFFFLLSCAPFFKNKLDTNVRLHIAEQIQE